MTEKTFVKLLAELYHNEGFLLKREIGVGYGVADLVLIRKNKFNVKNCAIRKDYGQFKRLLKDEYFRIFNCLPDEKSKQKPVSLDYLIKKTSLSKSFLKYNLLRTLEKNKYIKKEKENFYFKANGWLPLSKEVVAIEAKMRDWKRGFIQANRYKVFANKVFLAVPDKISHLPDKKLLRKHNIGLIVLNPDNRRKKTVLSPRGNKPLNEHKRNLVIEFFWGRNILRQLALL